MKLYNLLFEQEQFSQEELKTFNAKTIATSLEDVLDTPSNFFIVKAITPSLFIITSQNRSFGNYDFDLSSFQTKIPFTPDPNNPLTPDEQYDQALDKGELTLEDANYEFWEILAEKIVEQIPTTLLPKANKDLRNFIASIMKEGIEETLNKQINIVSSDDQKITVNIDGSYYEIFYGVSESTISLYKEGNKKNLAIISLEREKYNNMFDFILRFNFLNKTPGFDIEQFVFNELKPIYKPLMAKLFENFSRMRI